LLDFLEAFEQTVMIFGQQRPEQLQQITSFLAGFSDIVKCFDIWLVRGDRPLDASVQLPPALRSGLGKSSQSRLARQGPSLPLFAPELSAGMSVYAEVTGFPGQPASGFAGGRYCGNAGCAAFVVTPQQLDQNVVIAGHACCAGNRFQAAALQCILSRLHQRPVKPPQRQQAAQCDAQLMDALGGGCSGYVPGLFDCRVDKRGCDS
jgi:hypothetical protein